MTNIGRYQILTEIKRGGMGIVYKAFDPVVERELAIKTMFDQTSDDPSFRARFFREARSAGKLKHVNIVTVYDLGEENGRLYLVMEFLEGRDLRAVIHEGARPPLEEALRIMLDICRGLAHAHSREVIHRDIKPSNVFVTTTGEVKILDFGLARILSSITKSSELMGTPNYMSPEQWNREADHRSDIFAAGAVFYEMLTLRVAFGGENHQQVMFKIMNSDPERIERVNPALPAELSDIVAKALAKDPDKRYQSIEDLARELENFRLTLEGRKSGLKKELAKEVLRLSTFVEENKDLLRRDGSKALENLDQPEDYLRLFDLRERVARDLATLEILAKKRQELAPLVSEAVEHERCGRLDNAVAILEKIIQEDPGDAETVSLYENLNARIEAKRLRQQQQIQAARLLQEAKSRFETDDLSGCLARLDDVLQLQPAHDEALTLRDAVLKKIEQRAEALRLRAQELVADASARALSGDLTGAWEALDETFRLDPGNSSAVSLAAEIEQKLAEKAEIETKHRQAEVCLSAARKALDLEDLKAARDELEKARTLQPDAPAIGDVLEEINRAEEKKNKRERIAVFLEQSEEAFAGGNLQGAAIRAREGYLLDPQNAEAARLLDRIHKAQEERLRHRDWKKILSRAATLSVLAAVFVLTVILIAVAPVRRLWWPGPERQYGPGAREAFNRGQYDEANRILDLWLKKDAQSGEAGMLRLQSSEIQNNLKVFESAVSMRNYVAARNALTRVQELNKLDPRIASRWSTLDSVFSPEFQDEFLGGLDFWNAPRTWRSDSGKLIVRGTGFGTLKGKYYEDCTVSFNLSFLNSEGAVWVLRAASDLSDYYMFRLTGPKGTPPNSFAGLKVIKGKKETVLSPIPVGANLGREDEQFNITIKAVGDTTEHLIEVVSEPAEGPRLLGRITDPTLSGGSIGFGTTDSEEFAVRAFKVLPIRKFPTIN